MVLFLCYTLNNRGLVMRKKNGFIATTLIYSFLLLFATLVIVIIGNYTYYRSTINAYNKGVNDSLNKLIDTKYVTLTNLVNNSDFESRDSWSLSGSASYSGEETMGYGVMSLKFNGKSNALVRSNYFNCVSNHFYYISYQTFTNGTVGPIDTGVANASGSTSPVGGIDWGALGGFLGGITGIFCAILGNCNPNFSSYVSDVAPASVASGSEAGKMGLFYDNDNVVVGESVNFAFLNKARKGYIGQATRDSSTCNFAINYNNNNNTKMIVDNVVVTDVTDIVDKGNVDGTKYGKLIEIFNTTATSGNIPYFKDTYIYNMDNLKNNLN